MTTPALPHINRLREHRYALLLVALLATIGLGPVLEAMDFGDALMEGFLGVALLAAVFPTSSTPQRRLMYMAVVVVVLLRWLAAHYGSRAMTVAGAALWTLLALLVASRAVRFALSSVRVDTERLCAAISAYLLLGVCWGVVYAAMSHLDHDALLVGGQPPPTPLTMADTLYFSFVTLATLGYGDITPTGPVTRGIAIFEAIVGQFYLAILVARLVGLQTASHSTTTNASPRWEEP